MWIYNGKEFTSEDIGEYFGFIYLIIDIETERKYIGKKQFYFNRKDPKKTTAKRKKRIKKESDWKDYYGSNEGLKFLVESYGRDRFSREILLLCKNLGELNYNETKYLFKHDVLESDKFFNDNIAGKWFAKNVQKYSSSLNNLQDDNI